MRLQPGPEIEVIRDICEAARGAGGRALLTGGLVRDRVLAALEVHAARPAARDLDLEIYGLDGAEIRRLLERFGRVDTVGEAFTVYKMTRGEGPGRAEIDVSLPRRDSRTGRGHRGFTITGDPKMSVEEASRRRDFTINALLWDPLTGEVIDPHGGIADLRVRILRAVDPASFPDDPLRPLRALQFAARFEARIDPKTVELCRGIPLDDLPSERIWGEMEKLLLRARRPSIGLGAGLETGVMEKLFPEITALAGCPQDPEWHPEGDVWVHTLQVVDQAVELLSDLPKSRQVTVMLAALCHDLGKPATTEWRDGRLRSFDHEEAGVAPTRRILDRLNLHTLDNYDVRGQVLALVANHLKPAMLHRDRHRVSDGAFRRLARKCDLDLLYRVSKADSLGRRAAGAREPDAEAPEWFRERVTALDVAHAPPRPLLMGRHLLDLGLHPGPRIGEITRAVYELQLDGAVTTLDEAIAAARRMVGGQASPS